MVVEPCEHARGAEALAAVLWMGGISFAGVVAFIFAELIVVPIVLAYRKYYGLEFAPKVDPVTDTADIGPPLNSALPGRMMPSRY